MHKVTLMLVGILTLAAVAIAATTPGVNSTRAEVEATVKAYVDAQNRGDVIDMMALVSRRDDVVSISDGEIQRGWQTIRNTNDQIMDREGNHSMAVGNIDVMVLGPRAAVAVAPFTFTVASAQGSVRIPGATSFVFEKMGDRWYVVHEHTSITTQELARGID
jgi:uncharacterized protein (TIGR02246 family)